MMFFLFSTYMSFNRKERKAYRKERNNFLANFAVKRAQVLFFIYLCVHLKLSCSFNSYILRTNITII